MLIVITNFLDFPFFKKSERSWNTHPNEIIEESIPVRLSEKPRFLVKVARKEPATIIAIKYSSVASII